MNVSSRDLAAYRRSSAQVFSSIAVLLLLLSGCAGSDNSQVASGPGTPVATTAPLAVPPVLLQPGETPPPPTTAPADAPVATQVPATAIPTVAQPDPTAAPTAEAPTDAPTTTAPEATAAPAESATAVPAPTAPPATAAPAPAATAVTAAPAPAPTQAPTQPAGASIPLGDFEVVNLVTRSNQNIAELAPSGATLLWFWAPH